MTSTRHRPPPGSSGADLRAAGGVVQDQQRPLPGHPVPPHRGPAVQVTRYEPGVHPGGGEQPGQRVLRCHRLAAGGVAVQVDEQLPVRELLRQHMRDMDRQGGLARSWHPVDRAYRDHSSGPGRACHHGADPVQFLLSSGERGGVRRQRVPHLRPGRRQRVPVLLRWAAGCSFKHPVDDVHEAGRVVVEPGVAHLQGVEPRELLEVAGQLLLPGCFRAVDEYGDDAHAAFERGPDLVPHVVFRVVDPAAAVLVCDRQPLGADKGDQDHARVQSGLDGLREVDTPLN